MVWYLLITSLPEDTIRTREFTHLAPYLLFTVSRRALGHPSVYYLGIYLRNTLRDGCRPVLDTRTIPFVMISFPRSCG
jgi:hypothetical protein